MVAIPALVIPLDGASEKNYLSSLAKEQACNRRQIYSPTCINKEKKQLLLSQTLVYLYLCHRMGWYLMTRTQQLLKMKMGLVIQHNSYWGTTIRFKHVYH